MGLFLCPVSLGRGAFRAWCVTSCKGDPTGLHGGGRPTKTCRIHTSRGTGPGHAWLQLQLFFCPVAR